MCPLELTCMDLSCDLDVCLEFDFCELFLFVIPTFVSSEENILLRGVVLRVFQRMWINLIIIIDDGVMSKPTVMNWLFGYQWI